MKKLIHALTMYYLLIKFTDFWRGVIKALDPAFKKAITNKTEELLLGGPEEAAKFRAKRMNSQFRTSYSRMAMPRIVVSTREEAAEVIDKLRHLLKEHKAVSVAELYEFVGLTARYTDETYGWKNLSEARITGVKDGYRIDLPPAERFQ